MFYYKGVVWTTASQHPGWTRSMVADKTWCMLKWRLTIPDEKEREAYADMWVMHRHLSCTYDADTMDRLRVYEKELYV